ncbi:MAG: gamma-glutamyl-gamma-aminobutyrate hydrolase family protein [Firmicutes bacterium]|nr:gamma-glutamyl-gamma-aminobutyrate hydrolase family protein [Bacillota bacterium]
MIRALITQREELNRYGDIVDSLEKNYIDFFNSMDISAIPISNFTNEVETLVESIKPEIIIFSGGGILPEKAYSFKKEGFQQINRNKVETKLLEIALKKDIPILGICRGMQVIACHFGGIIDDFRNLKVNREVGKNHKVILTEKNEETIVNNFHNDGFFVNNFPNILKPVVIDKENNTVEAFAVADKKLLGIQWHPERMAYNTCPEKLFKYLFEKYIVKK